MQEAMINDVTGLNPIPVWAVVTPKTIADVQQAVQRGDGSVSIGGGRFSMGGQTASSDSLHIDMRQMNKVLQLNPQEKTIHVQSGIRWCDIQRFIDPHDLSVKIMQTYANFTVGGSLSVNCHGRYVGLGPLITSVLSIKIVMIDGSIVHASSEQNSDVFFASIGGYGAIGVIVEVELQLADNVRLERLSKRLKTEEYLKHFEENIRSSENALFHNADMYPNHYSKVNAVTWVKTKKAATHQSKLMSVTQTYWLEKYFFWRFSETLSGNWLRENVLDPFLYISKKIHWRNYEASYDAAELEPLSRKHRTYVLQEYFVPIKNFNTFVPEMREVLNRYKVNVINISIRHAKADPGSMLAWAKQEVFAFVLYYKQRVQENDKQKVALWTRELIDVALAHNGSYYLPYQVHATHSQFHAAYPNAKNVFALKRKFDPDFRFRNIIWDTYYTESALELDSIPEAAGNTGSEFHNIYANTYWRDKFFLFLQNVFRLYPEDRFHTLIRKAIKQYDNDQEIYQYIQNHLVEIKPRFADFTYGLPALKKQKTVMLEQTTSLLNTTRIYNGYLEIGSTGRYYSALKKKLKFSGNAYFSDYIQPTKSLADIIDRGQVSEFGPYFPLNSYAPINSNLIPDSSLDLVTCYIGLHHIDPEKQSSYVKSIARVLRRGGIFILRDHDAKSDDMKEFVALVHSVFNMGTGEAWVNNENEPRYFEGLSHWSELLALAGLVDQNVRLYQDHDPSRNALMMFVKDAD